MKAGEVLQRYAAGERNFQGIDLRGQSFKGKDLSGADFSGADIRGTNFKDAILRGAKFCRAKAGLASWKRYFLVSAMLLLSALSGLCSVWAGVIAALIVNRSDIVGFISGTISLIAIISFFSVSRYRGIVFGLVPCAFLMIIAVSIGVIFNRDLVGAGAIAVAIEGTVVIAIASTVVKVVTETVQQENRADWGIGLLTFVIALTISMGKIETVPKTSDSVVIIISIIVALGITTIGIYISRKGIDGHKLHNWVLPIALFLTRWGGTNFEKVNLTKSDFTDATLINSDFRKANLDCTCWKNAKKLERAQLYDTILDQPAVRDLLVTGQGEGKSYIDANLRGANLGGANLKNANLKLADLSEATLEYTNLERANLTQVNAISTNFTNASLTGACIEAWNIESSTILKNIDCRYIYLLEYPKLGTDDRERRPSSGEFQDGEFTKLFEEVMNTVDLIFRNGVDWKAFFTAFKKVQVKNEDAELEIKSIENKGDGVVVVKVQVPPDADKEKIHRELTQKYELSHKKIEEKYKAQLEAKNYEIIILHQQKYTDMMEITKLLASQTINIEAKAMSNSSDQSRKFTVGGVGGDFNPIGSPILADNATISGTIADTINQLPSSSNPEQPGIKELLEKLKTAIDDPNLSEDDKQQTLQQLQSLAEAAKNPKDGEMQKKAKKAIGFLKVISEGLAPAAKLVTMGKDIIPAIAAFFGL